MDLGCNSAHINSRTFVRIESCSWYILCAWIEEWEERNTFILAKGRICCENVVFYSKEPPQVVVIILWNTLELHYLKHERLNERHFSNSYAQKWILAVLWLFCFVWLIGLQDFLKVENYAYRIRGLKWQMHKINIAIFGSNMDNK